MKKDKSDEPRDEFDRIQIPEFLARPFERLGGRPTTGLPPRPAPQGQTSGNVSADADADATENPEDAQPVQRQWWAGYRGKLLLYGAGTLVMVFLQSRGR
ncbi:hypothetical protein [Cryobacterium arcticum]|uniref:Uncharacterized protein n=1 Tax=Cryobacterium arcticum TaxID=670052 RepID=A0A1B1BM29_9MICO|nr:hypothetical protein [Cryobacterium arcticum]ANP73702.1 hypothetical protein PA27867_2763 [Cryobacterium arcticum]